MVNRAGRLKWGLNGPVLWGCCCYCPKLCWRSSILKHFPIFLHFCFCFLIEQLNVGLSGRGGPGVVPQVSLVFKNVWLVVLMRHDIGEFAFKKNLISWSLFWSADCSSFSGELIIRYTALLVSSNASTNGKVHGGSCLGGSFLKSKPLFLQEFVSTISWRVHPRTQSPNSHFGFLLSIHKCTTWISNCWFC